MVAASRPGLSGRDFYLGRQGVCCPRILGLQFREHRGGRFDVALSAAGLQRLAEVGETARADVGAG